MTFDGKPGMIINYTPKDVQFTMRQYDHYSIKYLMGVESNETLLLCKLLAKCNKIQEQPNGFLLYVHLHPDTKMSDLSAINKWLTELLNYLLFCSNKQANTKGLS